MNLASSTLIEGNAGPAEELSELVIRGYSPMGSVVGMSYGSAQVEAREGVIPDRHAVSQSVRVELSSGGDYSETSFATVSYSNLGRLLSALEKMEFTCINTERFKFTEVEYEVEGLKIIIFNNERGSIMWALSAETVTVHFNSLGKMGDLRRLIEQAKGHLDKTKI